ncbi:MAG: hypothetical protein K8I30_07595, partial [Anaerolineae bacterium]|nr:hypothetical protein [Anaerolineae bacterium]
AYTVENQTTPYGLVALWAGAGAKYTWRGICGCTSKIPNMARDPRPNEMYWWVGPDGSRMLMKWYSFRGNPGVGSYAELRDPSFPLDPTSAINILYDISNASGYPYNVIGGFGLGWDTIQTLTPLMASSAIAQTNASRKVYVSNETDFFEHFESLYGAGLAEESVTYGNEWELYNASMAEVTAKVKRSTEKLRGAEAIATLVSLKNAAFMDGRESARDLAWMDMGLYFEHNWGADGPVARDTRAAWSKQVAAEIVSYVDTLHTDAVSALGGMIAKSGTNTRFFAFNPLSWTRTDAVDFPYPLPASDLVHVIDVSTGQETPSQIVTIDGVRYLRVLAEDVPSVGYKVFEIRAGAGANFGDAASVTGGNALDNGIYKVTVTNRGAITSIIDHTRGNREFVQALGTPTPRTVNDFGTHGGTTSLSVVDAGPVSVTLMAVVTGSTYVDITAYITLFRDSSRIDIRNYITENFGSLQTWSFGFNLSAPDLWHEEVGAIIRARRADGTANAGHYAMSHARYDWLTLNHFADMTGTGPFGVTLSNWDCQYVNLGNSSPTSLDIVTPRLQVLAGGQVDGGQWGIRNQGLDALFLQRFALQTHGAYDPAAAMRFSLEHQNPLVAGEVTGGNQYPETNFSLLSTSNPNVLLWALKPADDGIGEGVITRWWNVTNANQNLAFSLPGAPITSAEKVSHIETPQGAATVNAGVLQSAFAPQQMQTFLLQVSNASSQPGVPVLVAPENQANTPTLQPQLLWNAAAHATRYEVQLLVDTPPGDTDPVINTTPTSYTPSSPLLAVRT